MNILVVSYTITALCSWVGTFLFPLIILEITNSPFLVTLSYAIGMAPYLLITPFVGVLGDFYNKKRLLQTGELMASISCIVIALLKKEPSTVPLLFILQFIFCSSASSHHPIFQSIINFIVEEKKVARFNSYISIADNIIAISAPALIGVFLKYTSKNILLINIALLYILSYCIISFLRYTHTKHNETLSFLSTIRALKSSFKFIKDNKIIFSYTLLFLCSNFFSHFFSSNYLYYLKSHFNIDSDKVSYYYIPRGIISVICAFMTPFLIKRFQTHQIVRTVQIISGVALLSILFVENIFSISLMYSISIGITPIIVVSYFTLRQKIVPKEILSRIVSISRMITHGAIPLGALAGGYVFEKTNNFHLLIAISGFMYLLSVFFVWSLLKIRDE